MTTLVYPPMSRVANNDGASRDGFTNNPDGPGTVGGNFQHRPVTVLNATKRTAISKVLCQV